MTDFLQFPAIIELSDDEVKDLLTRAVEERGRDFIYQNEECQYFDTETGEPDCGVGLVFSYKGLNLETFHALGINSYAIFGLVQRGQVRVSETAGRALERFQDLQDSSKPWGECFDAAISCFDLARDLEEAAAK